MEGHKVENLFGSDTLTETDFIVITGPLERRAFLPAAYH